MKLPSIEHPAKVRIRGIIFRIFTYAPITDRRAKAIALAYYKTHKFKKLKKDQHPEIKVFWNEEM